MKATNVEIEAKFAVPRLDPIRRRLLERAARLVRPRMQETNRRFDDPAGRLRQSAGCCACTNHETCLTYKAPGADPEHRTEIEVGIDDAAAAQQILEGLGYQVVFVYEKYRETYALDDAEVMLDELPFGQFVEIEADDLGEVQRTAEALGLPWAEKLALTYLRLFESLRERHAWPFRDATFANFAGRPAPAFDDLIEAGGRR
jgi:adenylate cyclase class 2